jgi:ethanolamine utilization protein EutN
MQLGRVRGTLVATVKSDGLEGIKFLLVEPLDRKLQGAGDPLVCADATFQAGPGELVYFIGGREAAVALPEPFVPVDHTIVGIADAVRDL